MRFRFTAMALATMALTAVHSGPAMSADFYKGKTVKIIVGYSAGGGYDIYARILASNIGRYLPGKPRVIVQNMTGAGSLRAYNYLYNKAPKDGTVFGTFGRGIPLMALTSQGKNVRADASKFTWIGTPASYAEDTYILLARSATPIKNVNDLRKKGGYKLIVGTTAIGSTGTDIPLVLRNVLGLNLKLLSGYPGGSAINLGIERAEVDARMLGLSSINSTKPQWLTSTKIMRPLLQFARKTRHPTMPDVPLASELARNDEDRALIQMMELSFLMARPYAAPPGIPPERAKLLRTAFMKAANSKEYRDKAAKLGMEVTPKGGEEIQGMIEKLNSLPKKLIKRYENILANPGLEPRKIVWVNASGKITKLAKKNRRVSFMSSGKTLKTRVEGGGYTKIKIGGKKANRRKLKVGMTCNVTYEGNNTGASLLDCKK
jgi:tripartite-type tricarboxylate transporter receptor subunit TctC